MQFLSLILQALPLILGIIQQIEALFPQPGSGALKNQVATNAILPVLQALSPAGSTTDSTSLAGEIQTIISIIVTILNALGIFKPTPTPTPAPVLGVPGTVQPTA